MRYACLICFIFIFISCRKTTPAANGKTEHHDAIFDEYMQPAVKLMVMPSEAPLPERPYTLIEYTNVQRAYNNIPQSRSYTYNYSRTVQREAGSSYTPPSTITVDFDTYQLKPGIDVAKILDCFATVPDINSICSIELLTDLPVDGKPELFFDWTTGSPGHTFIQLKKTNGTKSVTFNVGYYPIDPWKIIYTPNPIPGKFVDDTKHEYNAAAKMTLSSSELLGVILMIRKLSRFVKYDIDEFNCTDFAIQIFNVTRRSDPIVIPKYRIPAGYSSKPSSTPQGLYKEMLRRMKNTHTERIQFRFPLKKAYVEPTNIPCK